MLLKAIFLDRDGVLNKELGHYVYSAEEMQINMGAINFLKSAIAKGFTLIVITNQGGIAKGLYSHDSVALIHQKMKQDFAKYDIHFAEFFYCPHHPDFGKCLCRKPESLLIEKAIHKFNIDVAHSMMIGDKERDVQAASNANIKGVLIEPNADLDTYPILWEFILNG
jgi:D-glycero-D-manno-heptose 1,7-bisphosphate phosphatase